jgi:hypothetical protein
LLTPFLICILNVILEFIIHLSSKYNFLRIPNELLQSKAVIF